MTITDNATDPRQSHAELLRQSGLNGLYFLAAAVLLVLIDSRIRAHPLIAGGFLLLLLVLTVVRLHYYLTLRDRNSFVLPPAYFACMFVNVFAWGCFTAWLLSLDPDFGMLAAVAISSTAAAAAVSVVSLTTHPWLSLATAVVLFAPPLAWLAPRVVDDQLARMLLAMSALYLVLLTQLSRRLHASYLAAFAANRDLMQRTAELEQARNDAVLASHALEAARNEALGASSAKSEFLAHMSHDIRTPLNGIVGMADVLARTPLSEQQRSYLGTIAESGRLVLNLINDILDFSQIHAGKIRLLPTRFRPRALAGETIAIMQPMAEARGNRLDLIDDTPAGWEMVTDRLRLQQILTNLLSNAIRFTDHGLITVLLALDTVGERQALRLVVRDTGIGIAREEQSRIFEEFHQVAGEPRSGSGLGLAICRKLTEALGGVIAVDSDLGMGTSFRVQLPVLDEAAPEAPGPRDSPDAAAAQDLSRHIVVIVERRVNALLVEAILDQLGVPHLCVSSADAHQVANRRPALVLMECDVLTPGHQGFVRTLREYEGKEAGNRVPVIAIMADASPGQLHDSLAADVDDYVTKPLTLGKLHDLLGKWLPGSHRTVS